METQFMLLAIAIIFTTSNVEAIESHAKDECPSHFKYIEEGNKCYRLEAHSFSWDDARLRCRRLHPKAHSVVINDAHEQKTMAAYLNSISEIVKKNCYNANNWVLIWTAGQRSDPFSKSNFVWKPDESNWKTMSYTNWNNGEPNGPGAGGTSPCLHLVTYPDYKWNDHPCSGLQQSGVPMCVLCEIDMDWW